MGVIVRVDVLRLDVIRLDAVAHKLAENKWQSG